MEIAEQTVLNVVEDIKQGGSIGLQAKYGNVSIVDAFRSAKRISRAMDKQNRARR